MGKEISVFGFYLDDLKIALIQDSINGLIDLF